MSMLSDLEARGLEAATTLLIAALGSKSSHSALNANESEAEANAHKAIQIVESTGRFTRT
jgi:hypothetical protein